MEKSDQIKNKLNYNLYILTSFTPLYNDLLKKELEKKIDENKDIITLEGKKTYSFFWYFFN